jgi:hypothetical protein
MAVGACDRGRSSSNVSQEAGREEGNRDKIESQRVSPQATVTNPRMRSELS